MMTRMMEREAVIDGQGCCTENMRDYQDSLTALGAEVVLDYLGSSMIFPPLYYL
jgi:hypothetical protein